jgi:transcriptional regulator with XRE-family HTH domain
MRRKPKLSRDRAKPNSAERGIFFARLRMRHDWSLDELHVQSRISKETLRQVEKGCGVDENTIKRLARLYGIPWDKFVFGDVKKLTEEYLECDSELPPKSGDEVVERVLTKACQSSIQWSIPCHFSIESFARSNPTELDKASGFLEIISSLQHLRGDYPNSFRNSYAAALMRAACGRKRPQHKALAINCAINCLKVLRAMPVSTWIWQTTALIEQLWDGSFKTPSFLRGRLLSELGAYSVDAWFVHSDPESLCKAASELFMQDLREVPGFVSREELHRMRLFCDRTRGWSIGLKDCEKGIRQLDEVIRAHKDLGDDYGAGNTQVARACVLAFHDRRSQFSKSQETNGDRINNANRHTQILFTAANGFVLHGEGKDEEAKPLLRTALREMSNRGIRAILGPNGHPLPFLQFYNLLPSDNLISSHPIPKLDYFPLIDVFHRLSDKAKARN